MYLIAACLSRLRPLIIKLHTTLSASFSSLLARRYGSDDPSPSSNSPRQGVDNEKGRLVPRIDVNLTGQGNLDSLVIEEELLGRAS